MVLTNPPKPPTGEIACPTENPQEKSASCTLACTKQRKAIHLPPSILYAIHLEWIEVAKVRHALGLILNRLNNLGVCNQISQPRLVGGVPQERKDTSCPNNELVFKSYYLCYSSCFPLLSCCFSSCFTMTPHLRGATERSEMSMQI